MRHPPQEQVDAHCSDSARFAGVSPPIWTSPGGSSQARANEALLLEMLDIGIADKKEGGCHEVAHFCTDRGGLRCAMSYGTGNP